MGVAVLWTTTFTLAHQRCRPNSLCLWGQTRWPHGTLSLLPCNPALWKRPAHRCSPSLHRWHLSCRSTWQNAWCHHLTPTIEEHWHCQPQHQQVLGYKGMQVRTEGQQGTQSHEGTSCHWWISEDTSQPKGSQHCEGYWEGRSLTLSWHSYCCSGRSTMTPSLTHWRYLTHSQQTKDTIAELTRCTHWSFTVAVWLSLIEKFLYLWWSTRANNAKMIATLMCVSALCLVVMVSVELNCLLWVNHCFHFLFFQGFCFWG